MIDSKTVPFDFDPEVLRRKVKEHDTASMWMISGGETRPSIILSPGGSRHFKTNVPGQGILEYALLARNDLSPEYTGSLNFQIKISDAAGNTICNQVSIYPGHSKGLKWSEHRIQLTGLKPGEMEISISVDPLNGREKGHENPELWAFVGSPVIIPSNPDPQRKNIIFFLMDTLRADHLGCYGYPRITSPFIDQLSRRGVMVKWMISASSWTIPSVNALMSGCYPGRYREIEVNMKKLRPDIPMLAEMFSKAGYFTIGISSNILITHERGYPRGFDVFDEDPTRFWQGGAPLQLYNHAMEWIHRYKDRPLFVYFHSIDPHDKYNPPEPYSRIFGQDDHGVSDDARSGCSGCLAKLLQKNEITNVTSQDLTFLKQQYDAEIRCMDGILEWIVRGAEKILGKKNLSVILTADHGEEFYEHELLQHGRTLYDECLWIPFVFYQPGKRDSGRILDGLYSIVDVCPTLLDTFNIPDSAKRDGRSVFSEMHHNGQRYIFSKLHNSVKGSKYWRAVHWGDEKIITYSDNTAWYFNLSMDPGERVRHAVPEEKKRVLALLRKITSEEGSVAEKSKVVDRKLMQKMQALGYVN